MKPQAEVLSDFGVYLDAAVSSVYAFLANGLKTSVCLLFCLIYSCAALRFLMKKKVVVIGSGLAGSLLCNELVKVFNVTLLERGPKGAIELPRVRFSKMKLAEVPTFCFGRGGTTNLWHNGLIPINIEDIISKDFRDILIEAQPYMDEAASALFFKNGSFMFEYEKFRHEINAFFEKSAGFQHGIDCLIYPKKYQRLTVDSRVNDVYMVQDIDFVSQNSKIISITYATGGQTHTIFTDYIIVSAGAIGSPGILQKIIDASGICFDNVGLGFIDHPMGFVGKVKFKKEISGVFKKFSSWDRGDYVGRSAVRLKSQCGRYTACAFFRPALTMNNNLSIYKYKSLLGANKGVARLKNVFSLKLFHPDILAEIFAHIFGINLSGRTFNILFIAEQKRGNNSVDYERDGLKVNWAVSNEEISIYRNMLGQLKTLLSGMADEINIETDISEDWLGSSAHHSGTVSVGNTTEDLVDSDLKLKKCDNVFVCDGSVIQEHSYANTGLTIGQLAFRLAKRIQDDIKR